MPDKLHLSLIASSWISLSSVRICYILYTSPVNYGIVFSKFLNVWPRSDENIWHRDLSHGWNLILTLVPKLDNAWLSNNWVLNIFCFFSPESVNSLILEFFSTDNTLSTTFIRKTFYRISQFEWLGFMEKNKISYVFKNKVKYIGEEMLELWITAKLNFENVNNSGLFLVLKTEYSITIERSKGTFLKFNLKINKGIFRDDWIYVE